MKKQFKKVQTIEFFPEVQEKLAKEEMILVKGGIKPPVTINVNCGKSCASNVVCW